MSTLPIPAKAEGDVELLERLAAARARLLEQVGQRIVGQRDVLDGILTALLAGGHALLVGVPGLAKTLMVSTLAEALHLKFSRIQFTPDLMPSDITGTEVIEEDQTTGAPRASGSCRGRVFANIVLADEINRTPPKTQAALLQAMQEHAGDRRRPDLSPRRARSSCWRRRTPSSRKARTRCPRPSSTASCSSCTWTTRPRRRRSRSSSGRRAKPSRR